MATKRVGDVVVNYPVRKKEDLTVPFYIHDVDTFNGRFGATYRLFCADTETPTNDDMWLILMAANDVRDQQMKQIGDALGGSTDCLGPCKFEKVHVGTEGRETYNIVDADAPASSPEQSETKARK